MENVLTVAMYRWNVLHCFSYFQNTPLVCSLSYAIIQTFYIGTIWIFSAESDFCFGFKPWWNWILPVIASWDMKWCWDSHRHQSKVECNGRLFRGPGILLKAFWCPKKHFPSWNVQVCYSRNVRHCSYIAVLHVLHFTADVVIWCVHVYCIVVNECTAYAIRITNWARKQT